jgi:hypothetical protein
MNINEKLTKLYSEHWKEFTFGLKNIVDSDKYSIKPSNPLLLNHSSPEKYENSDVKIMILGQENNTWEGLYNHNENNFESLLNLYPNFYGGEYYKYRGTFKNHYNYLVEGFKNKFPDKSLGFFWSNVIKIGKSNDKGLPPNYILDLLFEKFDVLQNEIDIIKPDIIVFLSGPAYDIHLKKQLKNIEFEKLLNYTENIVSKIKIPNIKFAFRTYHPKYMNFQGKDKYEKLYLDIFNSIDNNVWQHRI